MKRPEFAMRRGLITREHPLGPARDAAMALLAWEAGAIAQRHGGHVIGWELLDGLFFCRKRHYSTAEIAAYALEKIQRARENGNATNVASTPVATYHCPNCDGWHLTGTPRAKSGGAR